MASISFFDRKRREYEHAPFKNDLEKAEYGIALADWRAYHFGKQKSSGSTTQDLSEIVRSSLASAVIPSEIKKEIVLSSVHIEKMEVAAIVNAANETLLGGGGVDEAIHNAAGTNLVRECATLNGCEVGEAKITKGYDLPAHYVIHTVAPIYDDHGHPQPKLLIRCYIESLKKAEELRLSSLAFPCLGCGFYGFPIEDSANLVLPAVVEYLRESTGSLRTVVFSLFDKVQTEHYSNSLKKLRETK